MAHKLTTPARTRVLPASPRTTTEAPSGASPSREAEIVWGMSAYGACGDAESACEGLAPDYRLCRHPLSKGEIVDLGLTCERCGGGTDDLLSVRVGRLTRWVCAPCFRLHGGLR